jgi:hypothetical protein
MNSPCNKLRRLLRYAAACVKSCSGSATENIMRIRYWLAASLGLASGGQAQSPAPISPVSTTTIAVSPMPFAVEQRAPGIYLATNCADPSGFVRLDGSRADLSEKYKLSFNFDITRTALNVKATLPGTSAKVKTQKHGPIFYFHLTGMMPATTTTVRFASLEGKAFKSPFEFRLVRFAAKGGDRVADLGRISLGGGTSNGGSKTQMDFLSSVQSPGVYKVWTQQELAPGAYAFVAVLAKNSQGLGEDGVSPDVYDFSVE